MSEQSEPLVSAQGYCPGCGTQAQPDSSFCGTCGRSLKQQSSPSMPPPPPIGYQRTYDRPSGPSVQSDTTPAGSILAIVAGAVMAISAFLPWFTAHIGVATINRNAFQLGNNYGFSIDGVLLLVFGAIAIAIGISRLTRSKMPRWLQRSSIVVGVVVGVVIANRVPGITNLAHSVQAASSYISAGIGYGVWVAGVGAALAVIAGLVLRSQR